jgi:very-short-patch-repair endonuclease
MQEPTSPAPGRPTPPTPLPTGRGEESTAPPASSEKRKRNRKRKLSFSPLPAGRGVGGGPPAQPPVPHIITGQKVEPAKVEFAQTLRREMTPEETLLWSRLRGNRLHGLHFRSQQIIHGFIADFYCHAAGVVIEVDGDVHDTQVEYDAARDLAFATLGLLVLRFRNEEVTGRMPDVLQRIATACAERISENQP